MEKTNLDMLFYMSSTGDPFAEKELFNEFLKLANLTIRNTLNSNFNLLFNEEDFDDFVSVIFLDVLNVYDKKLSNFRTFSNFLLRRRAVNFMLDNTEKMMGKSLSLDDLDEEGKPFIDSMEDKGHLSVPDQLAFDTFKKNILVVKCKRNRVDKTRAKINCYLMQGYTQEEIMKKLNISLGTLRYSLCKNRKDKSLTNIELELK